MILDSCFVYHAARKINSFLVFFVPSGMASPLRSVFRCAGSGHTSLSAYGDGWLRRESVREPSDHDERRAAKDKSTKR